MDAIVQLSVADKDLSAPPGSPSEGARYIITSSPTGSWSGHAAHIAAYQNGAWAFHVPLEGWLAWVADEDAIYAFDGAGWAPAASGGGGSVNPVALVGVNATADATNRLSVSSPASLFDHEGAGHQLKVNKAAAGDTGSVLFQTGYSGRAEFGLAGDDDFHVKVSPDGSTWHEALVIDKDTGVAAFPLTPRREVLTSNRTYYVRTDGSDSNTGLANTSGGAFLTIQRAIEAAYALDCAISTVTISVQPGTYTAGATFAGPHLGGTNIVLSGSSATISTTNANCVSVSAGARVTVSGFTLQTTTAGYCILCTGGTVSIGANMSYGAAAGAFHAHLAALDGGLISLGASYSITGGAIRHLHADRGGTINAGFSLTVTISGTPAFTTFAEASGESVITTSGNTYSGSATGKRFNVTTNSALNVFSGALTLFPGNVAGTVASGGVYGSYLNWESINKTTDESTASDTTFSSDSQLQFTMLANSTYHVRGRVLFSTVAAADFKWQLTGPSSPTLVRIARRAIGGGDAAFSAVGVDTAFSTSVAVLGGGAEGFVEFDAAIQNGANAGTFAFQWAQNTSDAGNTTVRAGSYLEFIRMT